MIELPKCGILVLWILFLVICSGCGATMGPSQERLSCLDFCASAKNNCMLNAQTAAHINLCDAQNRQCVTECPP